MGIFKWTLLNENAWISMKISLKFVSKGPINKYSSIVSDGLAPNMRQAIIWTNDGLGVWLTYASLGLNEFESHANY